MPENNENKYTKDLHKVTPFQWIIILVLGLGILFGFYAGCGSNYFGVSKQLPPDKTIGQ